MANELIPDEPDRMATYILGQEAFGNANFVSWQWIPNQGWRSLYPKSNSTFSAEMMSNYGWQIIEKATTEDDVYLVTDCWGQKLCR
jgi:hypothetical protein